MQRATPVLLALVLVPVLTTCGDSDSSTGPGPQPPAVASVVVQPGTATIDAIGGTAQLSATARDASGNAISGRTYTWSSSNTAAVTVDENGRATAVANGAASVTASTGGVTGQSALTVQQVVASVEVSIAKNPLTALGEETTATAQALDSRGHSVGGKTPAWTSSDSDVAIVNASGSVTAVSNGAATITATVDDRSGSLSLTVNQTGSAIVVTTQPDQAVAGQSFGTQPVVEIRDANGNTVASDNTTAITASVSSGGGSILGASSVTAVNGVATFTDLGIGGLAGQKTLAFAANEAGSTVSAPFDLVAGQLSVLTVQQGDNQTAPAGTQLPVPLSVKATDGWNNGIPGVPVQWSITQGEGSLGSASTVADANGVASTAYTLGLHAGSETISAEAADLPSESVEFTVTATPNGTISGTASPSNALMTVRAESPGSGSVERQSNKVGPLGTVPALSTVDPAQNGIRSLERELIVKFRSNSLALPAIGSASYRDSDFAMRSSEILQNVLGAHSESGRLDVVGTLPAISTALVRLRADGDEETAIARLRADPKVERVGRNNRSWFRHGSGAPITSGTSANDPLLPWQAWHYAMIDLPLAWSITTGSSSVVVAVVDDGTRFDHPDLSPVLTSDGYDFVSYDLIPVCSGGVIDLGGDGDGWDPDPTKPLTGSIDPLFDCFDPTPELLGSHGVHVAGTIGAAGNNGYGVTGVNWNVSIRPVRVFPVAGGGSDWDIANGIAYAAGYAIEVAPGEWVHANSTAHIINMSLGGPADPPILRDAVEAAYAAGSLLIASAGNDGSATPNYPASYPEVVSVAAVGPDGQPASYTNFAPTVEIFAPGGDFDDGDGERGGPQNSDSMLRWTLPG